MERGQAGMHRELTDWRYCPDPSDEGVSSGWAAGLPPTAREVALPAYTLEHQSDAPELNWYSCQFTLGAGTTRAGELALLFEGVDHSCEVFLDGTSVGVHVGAEEAFEVPLPTVAAGDHTVVLRVHELRSSALYGPHLEAVPHRNRADPFRAGASWALGGVTHRVILRSRSAIEIVDAWVAISRGDESLDIYAEVDSLEPAGDLTVDVAITTGAGTPVWRSTCTARIAEGRTQLAFRAPRAGLATWTLDNPALHTARVLLHRNGVQLSTSSTRFGVREFDATPTGFTLNGEPLFVKMTHTVNDYPLAWGRDAGRAALRADLLRLKVLGFNMVRFIWGDAYREQIELCDEIGLLVYCESFAARIDTPSPPLSPEAEDAVLSDFATTMSAVMRKFRRHPSVVIWGLLNESFLADRTRAVSELLPHLRSSDPERVMVLNSGRFDGQWDIKGVASRFSAMWNIGWGNEAAGGWDASADYSWPAQGWPPTRERPMGTCGPFGDTHLYARVPHNANDLDVLERGGAAIGVPVFLTEYGIGSGVDLQAAVAEFDVARRMADRPSGPTPDEEFYRSLLEQFLADYTAWQLPERIGPPSRFLRASLTRMAGERARGLSAILANPTLVGVGLTGGVDQGMCGEGLATTTFRHAKPGAFDTIASLLEKTRLLLLGTPSVLSTSTVFSQRVILSDEHRLPIGPYSAVVDLLDDDGRWLSSSTEVSLNVAAADYPLQVSESTVQLVGPERSGRYWLSARLVNGLLESVPSPIHVVEPLIPIESKVWSIGSGPEHDERMRGAGADIIAVATIPDTTERTLLVWADGDAGESLVDHVLEYCRRGGRALVCVRPQSGSADGEWMDYGSDLEVLTSVGWLYQRDDWGIEHPSLVGVPGIERGLLDYGAWARVLPDSLFRMKSPARPILGSFKTSQGYQAGLALAECDAGNGIALMTTLLLDEDDVMAQLLLTNLLRYLDGHERARHG